MISALCELSYNSRIRAISFNLNQIYRYQNSLIKKKRRNFSYHWHFRSLTTPSNLEHIFLLIFSHISCICHYKGWVGNIIKFIIFKKKLFMNGWPKNNLVRSLNCFFTLSMIAKKCLHKNFVLLKSRHEQIQNVLFFPKKNIVFNFISFIPGSSEQISKDPSVCSLTESNFRLDTLWALSNGNVTNDRGVFCKYAGTFSGCNFNVQFIYKKILCIP